MWSGKLSTSSGLQNPIQFTQVQLDYS